MATRSYQQLVECEHHSCLYRLYLLKTKPVNRERQENEKQASVLGDKLT